MLLALLAVAAVVGLVVSFASWGFLEGVHRVVDDCRGSSVSGDASPSAPV
jgi:hypothetical protein